MEALDTQDPRTVGTYRVLGRIGEGGMGRVYLARNRGGRSVALKFIHADMAAVPGFRERFRREVDVVRRVAGAGTVPVVDAGLDEQHPWYASEYLPGPSLQDAVDRFGPLPADALWRFAADLAETLRHVHAQSLVHRDLKPSNVLLSTAGPRLIDFGIVHAALDTQLTMSGARIGTPAYMAPEQVYGEKVTPASDVYSYGLTLAFAATGAQPRRGSVARELPGMDAEFAALIHDCLAEEPGDRPPIGEPAARARARDTTGDTWLPAPVASLIARTSEQLLNLEAQAEGPGHTEADAGAGAGPGAASGLHGAATQGPGAAQAGPSAPHTPPPAGGFFGGFHGAATQGPATPPPSSPPYGATPPYSYGTPTGAPRYGYPQRSTPAPAPPRASAVAGFEGSGGLLGRPLFGLLWLLPMALCTYLLVFADPGFFGVLRALAVPVLLALGIGLMTGRLGDGAALGFWLGLSALTVQTWWAVSQFDPNMDPDATGFQKLVGGLNELLIIFPALGSLVCVYIVPAAIGRYRR
ncbi:serine/threonine-protein kinase [Streptomyces sp. NPDC052225]|uniref:serine/threonine-protein kinase n=1 Tax=Streptomyces sp. NPDC052225 TaxID=3154949 RepID=UPI00344A62AB